MGILVRWLIYHGGYCIFRRMSTAEKYSSHLAKLAMHISWRREAPIKNNNYHNRSEENALQHGFIGWVEEAPDKYLIFEAN